MIRKGYKTDRDLLFTITGQSNARGENTGTQYSIHLTKQMSRVYIWTGSRFEQLHYLVNNNGGNHGAELNIGYLASKLTSGNVYIVKNATGGTNLAVDWADGSMLWNNFVTAQNDAVNWLTAEGSDFNYIGNWWNQGEADANNAGFAADYRVNLTGLVNRFKRDCISINEGWQFVTVRLSDKIAPVYANLALVQEAQEEWKHVKINDLDLSFDGIHFLSDAQNEMGRRFINKVINSI